jgi:hypothetical protein
MAYTPPTLRSVARKMQDATLGTSILPYHFGSGCSDGGWYDDRGCDMGPVNY